MAKDKITIVGAGNVGATTAFIAATKQLGSIVLLDVVEGLAEGKALDIAQAAPVELYSSDIAGTRDWEKTADSDIVIITSGLPRKPGMSRDDLLAKNFRIVKDVSEKAARYSPDSIIIVVCNPLDAMVYTAAKVTGFNKNKIIGMAGALDSARFSYFLANELNSSLVSRLSDSYPESREPSHGISVADIQGVLMGGHGDDMVPLPRFTSVSGIPISEMLEEEKINELIERTRNGGIEIVNYLGYSAFYAPAAGTVKMVQAILEDKKTVLSCCAYCENEYNVGGYFVGVPAVLGAKGIEKIIELNLNSDELAQFDKSLSHVKELTEKVDKLL
jgi:malate dehydrogenase